MPINAWKALRNWEINEIHNHVDGCMTCVQDRKINGINELLTLMYAQYAYKNWGMYMGYEHVDPCMERARG